jgi:hypothetical protein
VDFADVVDWPLYFVDVSGVLSFYHQGGANDLGGSRDIQKEGLARLRRGKD